MRYMIIVKANAESEAGAMPGDKAIEAMGRFNDDLIAAGVLIAGEGLERSATGARISYKGGGTTVTHGPFRDSRDLIAGFWILDVRSRDEAIAWMKKAPMEDGDEVEIRRIFDVADMTEAGVSQELIDKEAAQRAVLGASPPTAG